MTVQPSTDSRLHTAYEALQDAAEIARKAWVDKTADPVASEAETRPAWQQYDRLRNAAEAAAVLAGIRFCEYAWCQCLVPEHREHFVERELTSGDSWTLTVGTRIDTAGNYADEILIEVSDEDEDRARVVYMTVDQATQLIEHINQAIADRADIRGGAK